MGFLLLEYFIDLKSKGFPFYKRILDLGSMSLLKVKNQPRYIPQFHQKNLNSLNGNKRFYQIQEKQIGTRRRSPFLKARAKQGSIWTCKYSQDKYNDQQKCQ
jgi:hypothetical protein